MPATLRVAVVGAGAWGINHVRALEADPLFELRWICDLDPAARLRAQAVAPRAAVTARLDDVLGDATVEAVVIATTADTHADLACHVLRAGKHALIEKPITLSLVDAERVASLARQEARVVLAGHLMVYHPAVQRLQDLVRSGTLGAVRYVAATRVNLGRIRREESVLWSFGPHDLSMLDYLLDELPVSVTAHGASFGTAGVEDMVLVTLRFASGAIGHLHLSRLDPHKERRLKVVGALKTAEFDDVALDKLRVFEPRTDADPRFTQYGEYLSIGPGDLHVPHLAMEEPLQVMLRHFHACCTGAATPRTGMDSALRVIATLAAAQASLDAGGTPCEVPRSTAC